MARTQGKGWHGEPVRHREAAMKGMTGRTGVRTVKRDQTAFSGSSKGGMYSTEWETKKVKYGNNTYDIPVGLDGRVPEECVIARYLNTEAGDRNGHNRNPVIDSNVTANVKIPKRPTPEQIAEWWAHPNECDILDIDTESAEIFKLDGTQGKGAKEAGRSIAILGGTDEQRRKVRESISTGFTVAEQRTMGGTTIHITDLKGAAGEYHGKAYGGNYLVKLDRHFGVDPDTVDHELIHHLRAVDESRTKPLTRKTGSYLGKDRDLEEAATVAESMSRHKPYAFVNRSYYGVMENGGTKRAEDRGTFTTKPVIKEPDGKIPPSKNEDLVRSGKKGKRALAATEKGFKASNIAHLRITPGKAEAIDQYYTIEGKGGVKETMQVYSPQGIRAAPRVTGQQTLFEWRDGKKTLVKNAKEKDDGLDPFDRFTLKHSGVVTDNDGVIIARATRGKGSK